MASIIKADTLQSTTANVFVLNSSGTEYARFDATGVFQLANPTTFPAGTAALPSITTSGDTNTGIFFPAADTIAFSEGGAEAMRIDSSGNVGIGTISPTRKLHISASGSACAVRIDNTVSGRPTLLTYDDSENLTLTNSSDTGYFAFVNRTGAGTERMRIDSSGNLLVGATSIVAASKVGISFAGSTFNGLGLNDTSPASGAGYIYFQSSGTTIGSITRVGATSAVAYNTTSDQRLKSNIENAAPVLEKLMSVKVRQYDWTEGDLHQDYGFIAQELEPVLSGVVTKGKTDEEMWQMDYSRLTPHLLKAIQEQQAIIIQLQADVAALKVQP